jgi:hypothetical protein
VETKRRNRKGILRIMDGEKIPNLNLLEAFRVKVERSVVEKFESEEKFMFLLIRLMEEIRHLILIVSSLVPAKKDLTRIRGWDRNKAILCAHLVRIGKLLVGIIDMAKSKRRELLEIFIRCTFESVVNLQYLIKTNSDKMFERFVKYSLRTEKNLLEIINQNIKKRGYPIPIENRMLDSIQASFRDSGISPEEIDKKRDSTWGGNILNRAAKLGLLNEVYLGGFAFPSHSVHGNWEDLLAHHLFKDETGFYPCHDWHPPRPQQLEGVGFLVLEAIRCYLDHLNFRFAEKTELIQYIDDLKERILIISQCHEEFLQRCSQ